MIINRKIKMIIILICGLLLLQACEEKNKGEANKNNYGLEKEKRGYFVELPSEYGIDEEPIVCVNLLNIDNYCDETLRPGFVVDILSNSELTEERVKVIIDVDTPYTLIHQSSEKVEGKFADYLCLNYNNMDWKKLRELEMDMSEEGQAELAKIKGDINAEYESIDEESFPEFFDNEFFVQFDMTCGMKKNEEFNTIKIVIGEKTYDVDVGYVGLNYVYEDFPIEKYGEYDLFFSSVGRIGYNILQSKEGIIGLYGFEALAEKDMKIKNVYLVDTCGLKKIEDVEINIYSEDITINRKWEPNKGIDIVKGSKLSFDFIIKDEEFSKTQNYATNIYIIVEYEVDGKTYINSIQSLCESRYDGQTLYAMFKDGVDMSEYYNVYYN